MARHMWTEDEDEYLRKHVGLKSAAQIAVGLNIGVDRNAVIGRMHRLKLSGIRARPVRSQGSHNGAHNGRPGKTNGPKPKGQWGDAVLREPVVVPVSGLVCEPVSFADRQEYQCSWPVADGMCCGLDRMRPYANKHGRRVTSPYCAAHDNHGTQPSKYRAGIWRGP